MSDLIHRIVSLAEGQERMARSWQEGVDEADNDTDRWYSRGRADGAEQAALQLRALAYELNTTKESA